MTSGPAGELGPLAETLRDGHLTLEQVVTLKQTCSTLAQDGADSDARLAAMTGYFFAIAAGLAHFDTNISSRKPEQLVPMLQDLAAVTPEDWSGLFVRATAALARMS